MMNRASLDAVQMYSLELSTGGKEIALLPWTEMYRM